jgi:hypothetical protein
MTPPSERTVIVDLRIPFWRLVMFFIKATFAAIPAAIVVMAILMLITALVAALFGGSMDVMMQRWRL